MRRGVNIVYCLLLGGCAPSLPLEDDTSGTSGAALTSATSEPTTGDPIPTTGGPTTGEPTTGAVAGCPAGDVVLQDQPAVEALAGCTEIAGSLSIHDDVTSLAPLAALTRIDGDLFVANGEGPAAPKLNSLAGLEGLSSIGGGMILAGMPKLTSLLPLAGLQQITGGVSIEQLPGVKSLEGLHNLKSAASIGLYILPALTDLGGLRGLETIGSLYLDQIGIADLHGLDALSEISDAVVVRNNPKLQSLAGLETIDWNGRALDVSGNFVFSDLGALTGVEQLRSLSIVGNDDLTDLAGLESLTTVEFDLTIVQNFGPVDIGALAGLESAGTLWLGNLSAPDLAALASLTTVGALELGTNDLVDLGPLPALQQVGDLELNGNALLTSLTGLTGLTTLGRVRIRHNDALLGLGELGGVTTIERLKIDENPVLTDLGLTALAAVTGTLEIVDNPALTAITGLTALDEIGGDLKIVFNTALPQADAVAWAAGLAVAGLVKIAANKDTPDNLDPCPWPGDGECDEIDQLCAPGSDADDCMFGD